MNSSKFQQIAKVEQLFDDGELDKAYQILIDSIPFKELNFQQQQHYRFTQGLILLFQNRTEELINLGEQMFNEGQLKSDDLQSFDGLFFILGASVMETVIDERVLESFKKIEKYLKNIRNLSPNDYERRKARLNLIKVNIYLIIGDLELADKSLEILLSSEKQLKNTFEQVWIYLMMTRRMLQGNIQYERAIEYTKKALYLAKSIRFNHFWIALCYVGLSAVNYAIGEFKKSLKHSLKSVEIYKKINNKLYLAVTLNNIGGLLTEMADYDGAFKYLQESLSLWEQGFPAIESILDSIITAALSNDDIELAQKYYGQLEKLYSQQQDPKIELVYNYNTALMLKNSSRIRDKAKAEKLFKRVADTNLLAFDIKIKALIHLCDIFLAEYCLNKDLEVLDDIDNFINRLLEFAEKSHSYLVFCETFILQAKMALIKFDMKTARRYLANAQKIAESHGMKRLAIQISYEHDLLLGQLKEWQELEKSEVPLIERIELAQIKEQMEYMVKKRPLNIPEPSDEESVIILIASEGGMPLFSQSFGGDKYLEDHLLAGFLSSINLFINEIFSEGLDRASFGKYTLLMSSLKPFLIFYIYKGNSYIAKYRINAFTDELKNNRELWEDLNHFYQRNREIELKEIPSLEPLVTKIFIDKKC